MEQLFFDFIKEIKKEDEIEIQDDFVLKGRKWKVLYKFVTGLALYLIGFIGFITLVVILYNTWLG